MLAESSAALQPWSERVVRKLRSSLPLGLQRASAAPLARRRSSSADRSTTPHPAPSAHLDCAHVVVMLRRAAVLDGQPVLAHLDAAQPHNGRYGGRPWAERRLKVVLGGAARCMQSALAIPATHLKERQAAAACVELAGQRLRGRARYRSHCGLEMTVDTSCEPWAERGGTLASGAPRSEGFRGGSWRRALGLLLTTYCCYCCCHACHPCAAATHCCPLTLLPPPLPTTQRVFCRKEEPAAAPAAEPAAEAEMEDAEAGPPPPPAGEGEGEPMEA